MPTKLSCACWPSRSAQRSRIYNAQWYSNLQSPEGGSMSNQPIDDADLLRFIQKERQRLDHISEAERQALIEQRVREVLAQERAEERQENEQAAEILSAELAYDPA